VIIGAILAFAVRADASAVDIQVVGLIFMLAGAAIMAFFRRERRQKQVLTRVEHIDGSPEAPEAVRETVAHETVYEGDEAPPAQGSGLGHDLPPAPPRSVHGYDRH
jgi:hypothetical protein